MVAAHPARETGRKEYRKLLNSRNATTFLTEEATTGEARGYVIATFERVNGPWKEARCIIYELFVDKGFRNQGAGKRLVTKVKTWAKERGANVLLVTAYTNNRSVRRFYGRLGFTEWSVTFNQRLKK